MHDRLKSIGKSEKTKEILKEKDEKRKEKREKTRKGSKERKGYNTILADPRNCLKTALGS